jgi:hypothetical protein
MEKYLTLEQAGDAVFVARWLREKGPRANRKEAELYFQWGIRDKRRRHWPGATRSFRESMIRYPGPRALSEYAYAELRMLGATRAEDTHGGQHKPAEMRRALNFYEAALAADAVLNSLSIIEKDQLHKYADCVARSLRAKKALPGCQPLL